MSIVYPSESREVITITMEIIEKLFSNNSVYFIFKLFTAASLSLFVMYFHSKRFKYLINRSTIYLTLMLPATILVLTQTIATNLYLSLGLIGALSIVRYRTPVKSQYELAFLFLLIAIGIITGVNPLFSLYLTVFVIVVTSIFEIISNKLNATQNHDLRFNTSGRVEVTLVTNNNDSDKVRFDTKKVRLLRIDENSKSKETYFLLSMDSIEDAKSFKKSLKIKPISIAIVNS